MSAALDDSDRQESIRMVRDSAAAVAPMGGDSKRIRDLRMQMPGYDPAVLRQMGELAWIGLRVPEAAGGAGLGLGEMGALAEELGGALAPEPLIPATISATLLAAAGAQAELGKLLSGESLVLTAWQERADTLDVPGGRDAARKFIPFAGGADAFLLPVREGGKLALYWQDAAGASLTTEQTYDGGHIGTLAPAPGRKLAEDIGAVLDQALDDAALVTGFYLLGGAERAFAMTLDYLKTRMQFGKIIGTFQALQHRAADLKMQLALLRASLESAAAVADAGASGDARRAAISRAKTRAAEASMLINRQCVQLSGGIGYTDQYDVGLYLRKAMVLSNQFGSANLHRRRYIATAAAEESDA